MTSSRPDPPPQPPARRPHRLRTLGLPMIAIIGLALLAVPRVVLHDLGLVRSGTAVNALLVFLPPLIWIVVVLWRRVPNAFLTLLVVGVWYGVLLAVGHQVLWDSSFAGTPPSLGGTLTDIDPAAGSVIMRTFAFGSSLITGTAVGAVAGLVAWLAQVALRRSCS